MIIARLKGGLGNQMFIYAASKALAVRNNTVLGLDTVTGFKYDHLYKRKIEITFFNIDNKQACRFKSFNYPFGRYIRKASEVIERNILYPAQKILIEKNSNSFDGDMIKLKCKEIYMEGYWQSEKYFSNIEQQLRNEFVFNTELFSQETLEEAERIKNTFGNSVSVGIRRYQEVPTFGRNESGGVLSKNYYLNLIEKIASENENARFFIFCEDAEWIKSEFKELSYKNYIISPKNGPYSSLEDMYLFSLCQTHIISNSSFYWWGAWLSNPQKKIVYAPDNFVNKDTIPSGWIKVNTKDKL